VPAPHDYDIAIVGFGPSGALAASLLGAQGLRTFVCDRLHDVYDKPRAIALDHEITRLFQQLGVAEAIAPFCEPFTDSVHYGVDGQEIRRMSTVPPPWPLAHEPSIVFTQRGCCAPMRPEGSSRRKGCCSPRPAISRSMCCGGEKWCRSSR